MLEGGLPQPGRRLSGHRHDRRPRSLISALAVLSLVLGGLVLANPGQAEEVMEQSEATIEDAELTEEQSDLASDVQAATEPSDAENMAESDVEGSVGLADPGTDLAPEEAVDESPEPSPGEESQSAPDSEAPVEPGDGSSEEMTPVDDPSISAQSADEGEAERDSGAAASLSVAPNYAAGDTVVVTGEGWSSKSPVTVEVVPALGAVPPTEVTADRGTFQYTFTLPFDASGDYSVNAKQERGKRDRQASAFFAVKPLADPTLEAQVEQAGADSKVKVIGSGWSPDTSVSVSIADPRVKAAANPAAVKVADDGTIEMLMKMPAEGGPTFDLTATGEQTGRVATAVINDASSGTITVRKAGSRTGDNSASPLDGAEFDVYAVDSSSTDIPGGATPDYTCTTGSGLDPEGNPNPSGECTVEVTWDSGSSQRYLVVEKSAPSGWSLLPAFATDASGSDPYRFNVRVSEGEAEVVPDTGSGSSEQWANRLGNPSWPGICGLDIALLFDESTSINNTEWNQMKQAAGSFVEALQGTPSRVAQFSFSTDALTGKYVPLTSVQSPADASALITQINAKTQSGGFTNWDEGLYQIAQKAVSYDAVLVLTDGDPTVYGNESSGDVRLVTVQEAVHSANAIKAEGTRIVGVGIGLGGSSEKNLAAISGPSVGSDYYLPAGFDDLDDALKEIASSQCGGTVIIEKQIGTEIPGSSGLDSNGWPFSSEITTNGANTTTVPTPADEKTGVLNERNGQLQYKYVGGEWPKSVRITELANPDKPGFTLEDIQCSRGDDSKVKTMVMDNYIDIPSIGIDETVTCIFLNSQDTGSLQVLKELSNPDGAVVPATFAIDYECKIADDVTKSGTVDVQPGMTGVTVAGVPTGSTCSITEQELTEIPGFTWAPVSYDPRSVEIETAQQTYPVKAANEITEDRGGLELVKELTGGPAGYTGPFTIDYTCTTKGKGDVSGSEVIDAGSSALVEGIPVGAECEVSEPVLPDAPTGYTFNAPTFDPANATVVIEKDAKATVTTANSLERNVGNLRISKSLVGTPADYDPEFDVSYTCTLEGEEDITGAATISNGGTVEVPSEGGIPTGYECAVIEGTLPALPAGYTWNGPVYTNNQATEPGNTVVIVDNTGQAPDQELPVDQMATVNIGNSATFSSVPVTPASGPGAGALTVSKTLTGGPAGFAPSFSIAWACSGATGGLSGVVSLTPGGTATVFNVPNGYTCSVSEGSLPVAPDGFSWGSPAVSGSPTPAISNNSTVSVVVSNSLIADEVAPVEPASPVQPTVPVEPASPDTPAQVEPAGVPLIVPAGGGGIFDINDELPVWGFLVTILSLGLAIWGAAYLLRSR
jgi:hypothetical protein